MGEPSSGRSATTPTFRRSTSVLTTTDRQCSHTVWTLLDQRNTTGAPQFGQLADGLGMLVRPIDPPDLNGAGVEEPPQLLDEIPVGAGAAAEEIQAERAVLREGVAGEMRLRKHVDAGDAARRRKLVPLAV